MPLAAARAAAGAGWRGSAVREFPWALGVLGLIAIAVLVALGALESTARDRRSSVALAGVGAGLARFAVQSLRTAGDVREALAELEADRGRRAQPLPAQPHPLPAADAVAARRPPPARDRVRALRRPRRCASTSTMPKARGRPSRARRSIQVHGGGWIVGSRARAGDPAAQPPRRAAAGSASTSTTG